MATDQDFAHELFERLTVYSLIAGREMVAQGVDVLWLGDDFGTQRGMLISPKMWRTFIKERYARLIAAFKAQNPALKIAYHCDGTIQPIIPDLIEIGLDVLNPIQPLAMDPAEIKRKFGKHLAFWGRWMCNTRFRSARPRRWLAKCGSGCGRWRPAGV